MPTEDYMDRLKRLASTAETSVEDRIALAAAVRGSIDQAVRAADERDRTFKVLGGEATLDYLISRLDTLESLVSTGLAGLIALASACEAAWHSEVGHVDV